MDARGKSVQTKTKVRRLLFWKACAAQIIALAGSISFIGHKYVILECGVLIIYFVAVALVLRHELVNNQDTHKHANKQSKIVFLVGVVPIIAIFLGIWLFNRQEDIPEVQLGIKLPLNHNFPLVISKHLTWKFSEQEILRDSNVVDTAVFPISPLPKITNQSWLDIEPDLINNSLVDVDDSEVEISLPKEGFGTLWDVATNWHESFLEDDNFHKYFFFRLPKIRAHTVTDLPHVGLLVPSGPISALITNNGVLDLVLLTNANDLDSRNVESALYSGVVCPIITAILRFHKRESRFIWQFRMAGVQVTEKPVPHPFLTRGWHRGSNFIFTCDFTNVIDENGNTNWIPVK